MKTSKEIIGLAQKTLRIEADGLLKLSTKINEEFSAVVQRILYLKGRVIVTGIGKSAIIAQKIVATLNSTGTPSMFMHAADAIHGDLGMIQTNDLVICISKSGTTPEIKVLIPLLKHSGNFLVGMVGDLDSYLAKQADLVLDTTIDVEACPHNLAPTTSTTAQLAMGDALAVCLLESREFSSADFAKFHPGGALGKRLYLKAGDLALQNETPAVLLSTPVRQVLVEMTRSRLGAVCVLHDGIIAGIITDGDIRRMMESHRDIEALLASDIMGENPKKIEQDELAVKALEIMRENNINQILVTSADKYRGMVHLHDLLKEGII